MRRSFVLRANPSVRQTQALLARLDRALNERGATTERGPAGELTFRMPAPWRFAPVGWLALVTRGTATLSAWGGGPWRVSYRLYFGGLQSVVALITLGILVLGWGVPRLSLLAAVLGVWIVGYAPLHILAAHAFRNLLHSVMADVLEQRGGSRRTEAAGASSSQQPE